MNKQMNDMFSKGKAMHMHNDQQLTQSITRAIRHNMRKGSFVRLPLIFLAMSGCVQVTAPDKPIVINLNISISQEILYKLSETSKKVVEANPGIF